MANKRQITKGLQEIGAAWAVSADKYICTNHQCCNALEGDKAAYHIHPDASEPRDTYIRRFKSLGEIAAYIKARKQAATTSPDKGLAIMEDYWAGIS